MSAFASFAEGIEHVQASNTARNNSTQPTQKTHIFKQDQKLDLSPNGELEHSNELGLNF